MENVYGVLNLAKLALNLEKAKAAVASENIANINTTGYIAKSINNSEFITLLEQSSFSDAIFNSDKSGNDTFITENPMKQIRLDQEVFDISNAEMRYQAIAQMIREKLGLIELTIGVKR